MRLRVFLLEANDAISASLQLFLEEQGHEVLTTPGLCPHFQAAGRACATAHPCTDAVIVGQHLPGLKGIEWIERRRRGGCKGLTANVALLCLPWSDGERRRAEALGCRYFETPLHLEELTDWLQLVARRLDPRRQLAPLASETRLNARAGGGG